MIRPTHRGRNGSGFFSSAAKSPPRRAADGGARAGRAARRARPSGSRGRPGERAAVGVVVGLGMDHHAGALDQRRVQAVEEGAGAGDRHGDLGGRVAHRHEHGADTRPAADLCHLSLDPHRPEPTYPLRDGQGEPPSRRAALGSPHGPGDLTDGARAGAADRSGHLPVGRSARGGVGRGADDPGQPPTGRRHRVHDDARLGRRHLGAGHLRPHPVRQPQPAARRGRQRGDPRQARLLRQPRLALAGRPRDPDGRARRAARPARAPASAARGRGSFRRRAEEAAAVPAPLRRAGHRPGIRRRARRRGERPPPLARRHLRDGVRRDAGHARRHRGDRRARPARPRPERST